MNAPNCNSEAGWDYHRLNSWEVYDARGIYLTRVCDRCEREKLAGYRPEVLRDPGYDHSEPISEDHWDY